MFDTLKAAGILHLAYMPDAGHATAILLAEADPEIASVVPTTEEAIGYLAGAWLGGQRGALLMQSSGVGNCINTLALPTVALPVVDRRDHARRVGRVQQLAEPHGPGDAGGAAPHGRDDLARAATMAFEGDPFRPVLLGKRLIGEKEWAK